MKRRKKYLFPLPKTPADYVLVLLVIVALGLGLLLIKPSNLLQKFSQFKISSTPLPAQKSVPRTALTPPPPNASTAENKVFFDAVMKEAKETPYLEVANCNGKPAVIKVDNHSKLLIKNSSGTGRHINFLNKTYTIAPNGNQEIDVETEKAPGIYGIGCDLLRDRAMGLVIIPSK